MRLLRLFILFPAAILLPSCIAPSPRDSNLEGFAPSLHPGPRPVARAPADPADSPTADHPATLLISPLTRIGADSRGVPAIVLHFSLRDAAGQPPSAAPRGLVRVELAGAESPNPAPPVAEIPPERVWEIDLSSRDAAASAFDDLVTRTYVLPLTDLPDWLIAWSLPDSGRSPRSARPDLRVWFTTEPATPAAPPRTLAATRRLTR